MGPRFGLIVPLSAVLVSGPILVSGPALAQTVPGTPFQAPISLAPPSPPLPVMPSAATAPAARPVARVPSTPANSEPATNSAPMTKPSPAAKPRPAAAKTIRDDGTKTSAPPPHGAMPRTLAEALAATYTNQPILQEERAKLRGIDENVPAALAGWRPQVQVQGQAGYGGGTNKSYSFSSRQTLISPLERFANAATAQVTQTLYNGGRTQATVNRSKNQVMAERATLIGQEQASFTAAVNAYVGVIQTTQTLELNRNNEQVLGKQLQATNDRFRVGEITRTDVAQAEAALAGARAQRETSAGQLETARGTFQQIIGVLPPPGLVPPQPLAIPVTTGAEAIALAASNNPAVVAALFADAAAKDAVDVAFAQLLPQLSVQGQAFQQTALSAFGSRTNGWQAIASLTVPIYQGGSEYAGVRQARQQREVTQRDLADKRRTAVQNAVQAWETLAAARAAANSTRSQIRANEIALEGVEREAIVGSRTTLDVLNAQQQLLNSRTSLVQNLAQVVTASYAVAAAIGRLTARDMHLPVPLYDETAYYNAVRDKWVGLGDYATNQPGR